MEGDSYGGFVEATGVSIRASTWDCFTSTQQDSLCNTPGRFHCGGDIEAMKTFLISCLVFGLVPNTSAAVRPLLRGKINRALRSHGETTNPLHRRWSTTDLSAVSYPALTDQQQRSRGLCRSDKHDRKVRPICAYGGMYHRLSTCLCPADAPSRQRPDFSSTLQTLPANRTLDLSLSGVSGLSCDSGAGPTSHGGRPCLSLYDRELWLRLSKESELSYLRIPSEQRMSTFWNVERLAECPQSRQHKAHCLPLQRSTLGAYIQAARWLQANGLRSDSTEEGSSKSTLVLHGKRADQTLQYRGNQPRARGVLNAG